MERKSYRKSFQGSFLKISCQNGSSIGDEKESRRVIVSLALMFVLLKKKIINNLLCVYNGDLSTGCLVSILKDAKKLLMAAE